MIALPSRVRASTPWPVREPFVAADLVRVDPEYRRRYERALTLLRALR